LCHFQLPVLGSNKAYCGNQDAIFLLPKGYHSLACKIDEGHNTPASARLQRVPLVNEHWNSYF
jgi:hypothetical protein